MWKCGVDACRETATLVVLSPVLLLWESRCKDHASLGEYIEVVECTQGAMEILFREQADRVALERLVSEADSMDDIQKCLECARFKKRDTFAACIVCSSASSCRECVSLHGVPEKWDICHSESHGDKHSECNGLTGQRLVVCGQCDVICRICDTATCGLSGCSSLCLSCNREFCSGCTSDKEKNLWDTDSNRCTKCIESARMGNAKLQKQRRQQTQRRPHKKLKN